MDLARCATTPKIKNPMTDHHCVAITMTAAEATTSDSSDGSADPVHPSAPFRVLGIALVVENRGKGAQLVVRYPVSSQRASRNTPSTTQHGNSSVYDPPQEENLFFTLLPRVMAKLFRPKKPLCGQPMTISVGGTVFCCRAVLFDDEPPPVADGGEEEAGSTTSSGSPLVLFNVIVALVPSVSVSNIPISGWFASTFSEETMEDPGGALMTDEELQRPSSATTVTKSQRRNASLSFLSIRQVHISLARLGRVLEREERRCRYVSRQSSQFLKIAAHVRSRQYDDDKAHVRNNSGANGTTDTTTSSISRRGEHRRVLSGVTTASLSAVASEAAATSDHHHHGPSELHAMNQQAQWDEQHRYEKEQELLELLLSAPPPEGLHGNLARELVDVFHALSRNQQDYTPTPSVLLSGSQGVVYIHSHLAVPIESAAAPPEMGGRRVGTPRPYHTLLFPHASPSELVETLSSLLSELNDTTFVATPQRRLRQLLLMASPRRSLQEIAFDTALPLQIVLDLAQYLVRQHAALISPVLTRSTRLACCTNVVTRLQDLSLAFSRRFYHQSIFVVTSLLTSKSETLDEVIASLTTGSSSAGDGVLAAALLKSSTGERSPPARPNESLEELVYDMAVWLRSHQVVIEVEEFLVAVNAYNDTKVKSTSNDPNNKAIDDNDKSWNPSSDSPEERMFQELVNADALTGQVTTAALCWRFGLTLPVFHRFRSWGLLHNKLRIVTRIAGPDDDY